MKRALASFEDCGLLESFPRVTGWKEPSHAWILISILLFLPLLAERNKTRKGIGQIKLRGCYKVRFFQRARGRVLPFLLLLRFAMTRLGDGFIFLLFSLLLAFSGQRRELT